LGKNVEYAEGIREHWNI